MKWSELTPRERDALVAEVVLGWRIEPHDGGFNWIDPTGHHAGWTETKQGLGPHCTTRIKDSWKIVKKMESNTIMEAICLAALRAKGVTIDD